MLVLAVGSKLITRKLTTDHERSRWQNLLEIVVTGIAKQIEEVGLPTRRSISAFWARSFCSSPLASLCTVIPGYEPPTGSLSTTVALALCVMVAVPLFGIGSRAGQLPQVLRAADVHHAAVQHHQRNLAHAGPGRPPVRQHDERGDDHRDSADHHALHLSRSS
jgi:hypothetical protein